MGQQRRALTPERLTQDRWGWELRARRDRAGLSVAALSSPALRLVKEAPDGGQHDQAGPGAAAWT